MPTYEYLCQTCSHRFEAWQKMIDEPLTTCPECGGSIRRVQFPAGVVFKGSGFYKTDYSSNGSKAQASNHSSEASNGAESKKSENSSTESKPAESSSSSSSASSGESKSSTPAA